MIKLKTKELHFYILYNNYTFIIYHYFFKH